MSFLYNFDYASFISLILSKTLKLLFLCLWVFISGFKFKIDNMIIKITAKTNDAYIKSKKKQKFSLLQQL